jgi:hypothetical protein
MRRYSFSLGTVLRARRAQESIVRANLQTAHMAATAAELAANASLAHYEEVIGSRDEELMVHHERGELAARAVIGAAESLAGARAAVTVAMNNYLAAAREVSLLERLDERRREQHALDARHEEATEVDELVINRHARREARARKRAGDGA